MDEKQFEKEIPVKRLRRELAYEGTILKVYKDYVDANGVHAVWDYIHHDGAAAVLPVTDEGKILMVRQYRNALDRFTLEIPAGKVDSADEPRRICAFRELEEETGIVLTGMQLVGIYSDVERDPRGRVITAAYAAMTTMPEATAADDAAAAKWWPLNALPKLAFDHDKILADAIRVLKINKHAQ